MKTILIMRHGEATPMQADDAARQLTETGHYEASRMGQWLATYHKPDALLVSPYIRAQQTAADATQHISLKFNETCSDITPDGVPQIAADYLETLIAMHPQCNTWLIVAHMPIVSYLVDQLSPGHMPIFNTGAVAVIEYDEHKQRSHYLSIHSPNNVEI
ncbi:phosphohistidine phosphatase SixA [Pseudoalteromonas shioyasakiensis]|uniref:phosphohistidine phosphatase SixA n=1 Tax=Pseudoalteromonas TaxID=53246 RepID=UPI000C900CD5|nr:MULTISPECIES: phosphohistidine phosphatase SixA [Pseudoalteromonas]MAD05576.1 phosphohistidine phosphatase SixA [Pseudoalteromonas sp.]MCG9708543.1 phosphohistidine phosphatase SixA [Pseudoalteromonas sp. Isolate3]MCQ8882347.1 phosphohistidine phosphatase SixA [Pseudoalteromonas shioyasakiensis]NIZ05266.1 phosphohistidine phosphatase SixA [Pseudoalteromonas sp. HF66]QLE08838.1 phosphohistidine phosphatase SixA [Pseudoalteromonas shioyasakiensis]|tara:strand:+ start:66194 stop:66670 length:477 start_codon:yes stop_codon:yes gene_type:complete|eukprot:gnl/Carplike_NY0171/6522_a8960_244.p1 GENE.gnl/Carplike_NY0171/6522_a8960_244~~gnl/Carplike_NY0171/6522_a8960_244.p1  ORF type:complete len:159 (-),score=15.76 gnl/Carplike_NY0171/6522_a8960_244:887-1363(-)